jgi:hypothetical protein
MSHNIDNEQPDYSQTPEPEARFIFVYSINEPDKLLGWVKVDSNDQMFIIPISDVDNEQQDDS